MTLRSSGFIRLDAASTAEMKAAASASIQGATVRLNNGSKPVARVGSQVVNSTVNTGAASVMVP